MTDHAAQDERNAEFPRADLDIFEMGAGHLIRLVRFHRERCDGNCEISLISVAPLYKLALGRDLSKTEWAEFI